MYEIGQIFIGPYPPDVAVWCMKNNAIIVEIESTTETDAETGEEKTVRQYQIIENIEPEPEPLTPEQLREQAYETEPCIEWQGEMITVDQANDLWLKYSAEGSEIANELSELIVEAKTKIRVQYPDTTN